MLHLLTVKAVTQPLFYLLTGKPVMLQSHLRNLFLEIGHIPVHPRELVHHAAQERFGVRETNGVLVRSHRFSRAETPPFTAGRKRVCFSRLFKWSRKLLCADPTALRTPVSGLVLDVSLDDFKRCPSTRNSTVAWTPEVLSPEHPLNFLEVRLTNHPGRDTLEGVDESRESNLRRILDQEVNVIRLVV
jgi:hypothetical protein